MANMMISPFLKSAAVILAKKAIVCVMNSASVVEFNLDDQWTDRIITRVVYRFGILV